MNRFLLTIILTCGSSLPSFADHGPFSMENGSNIHELHLGVTETINPTGEPKRFGIRACSTKELDFVNPWRSSQKGTIPFKVRTEEIVAFGLAGSLNSGLNKGNVAGAIGVITNPLSLPLSLISKEGGNNFQYSLLTINKENGRISQRFITLYSQKDVNYLNDYLKTSTGYNPGEQLTNKELEEKYDKKVVELYLVCLHPDNKNNNYQRIKVVDLQDDVKELFEERIKIINRKDK